MTIRQRGKSFMVDVKVLAARNPSSEDVRVRVTAKTRDDAIRLESLIRAEVMRTGRWSPQADDAMSAARSTPARKEGTLKAALKWAWDHPTKGWHLAKEASAEGQRRNAQMVIDFLGEDTLCCDIGREDFERAATHFKAKGNSNDTVTRKLQAFSRVLWFAERKGWIKARPSWDRAPSAPHRSFIFSPDLEAKVLDFFETVAWDPAMADLFRLGVDTGCRLGELLHLKAGDVNLIDGFITARGESGSTKNGEVREVALNKRAKARLAVLLVGKERGDRLFPGWRAERVSRRMVQCRNALGYEGEKGFTFHSTRHTCGTRMAGAGVNTQLLLDQLGHRSQVMARVYVNAAPTARRDAILKAMGE
jgi:integrase